VTPCKNYNFAPPGVNFRLYIRGNFKGFSL
jgi:hypothetical protein